MTEQVDFCGDFAGRAIAVAASGLSGTAGLSELSDFATHRKAARFDRRAAATRGRSTILKRLCRDIAA